MCSTPPHYGTLTCAGNSPPSFSYMDFSSKRDKVSHSGVITRPPLAFTAMWMSALSAPRCSVPSPPLELNRICLVFITHTVTLKKQSHLSGKCVLKGLSQTSHLINGGSEAYSVHCNPCSVLHCGSRDQTGVHKQNTTPTAREPTVQVQHIQAFQRLPA